jgi:D-sedoheptulose 7-phosphate isomerase
VSFYQAYFNEMSARICNFREEDFKKIVQLIVNTKASSRKVMIVGNGGSASIASHLTVDFTKNAGIQTVNFNDPCVITAFANDCGFENWMKMAVDYYGSPGDTIILISSSGSSKNVLLAAEKAHEKKISVVTLTGFSPDNPLRKMGQINLYVPSYSYNIVEITHSAWLVALVDIIIGRSVYTSTENVHLIHEQTVVPPEVTVTEETA